jgi:hypothetical protein
MFQGLVCPSRPIAAWNYLSCFPDACPCVDGFFTLFDDSCAFRLLFVGVDELLEETEYPIPPIEFGNYRDGSVVVPAIALSTCEQSEKERIIRLDAYTLTITFTVPEWPGGERNCYAYASSVATALNENPTLGGVASRAVLTGKKYVPPKQSGTGGDWEVILTLRVTVEGGC